MNVPLIHRTLPKQLAMITALTTLASLYMLQTNHQILLEWLIINFPAPLKMVIIVDSLGLLFSTIVLFISTNVLLFSKHYMHQDPFIDRFTWLVLLFIISMNLLTFIPHFMALLLGWDGLGITSFILVMYYQNPKSLSASMITALTNRIGDVMILISIALTINQGHWNILHMWHSTYIWPQIMCIMVAAMTKSAQMPFSSWLPAAMAAPTPVSALVHSSTLVTAGVFLLIRFLPFLITLPLFKPALLFSAICTTIMAGLSASTECDMKKIIALSTLSQLGVMMTALGLSLQCLATFHMMTHALFKALLFICAGSLISTHLHAQELRWMGNLTKQAPMASTCMLIANLALCGAPFMTGFYSKDLILEMMMSKHINPSLTILAVTAVMLTTFYSIRLSLLCIWGARLHTPLSLNTENMFCIKPMLFMSFMSIVGGAALLWLTVEPYNALVSQKSKLVIPAFLILGLATGYLPAKKHKSPCILVSKHTLSYASSTMWFLVPMSTQLQLKLPLIWGHVLLKSVDHSWLELTSGQGMNKFVSLSSTSLLAYSPKNPPNILLLSCLSATLLLTLLL